ncbi:LpqB family beta-propeller domain-containing protein [Cellulomonas composti]|uniref:Lipoprotein LpqB n=1 Tax=Cellulomonas composti TaxID=266130 RepID=A0A511JAX5_9CELL|nr:LpqB family beta-propeller domain-containing protein [Cellulomonas composti]GEL95136.1 lipoprotein LpqB [Cellulomonas composti]
MSIRRPRVPAALVGTWVALAALLALTGCVAIPTSGPVVRGDVTVGDTRDIDVLAEGPQDGADPLQIVDGFLLAGGVGFPDEFATAREYLTGQLRTSWQPLAGVLVAGTPEVVQPTENTVTFDLPVVAYVDADGRYTEAAEGARDSRTFELRKDRAGEWRISSAPDGLILAQTEFSRTFRSSPVYFLSADGAYLVPETRWFPADNLQTSVARALVDGPSPWLRDAVTTAVPEAVQLKPLAVEIDAKGTASVGLEPPSLVLPADRDALLAQFEASLGAVPGVRNVTVTTGSVILDGSPDAIARCSATAGPVEMLQAGSVVLLDGDGVQPVDGLEPVGKDASHAARDESGDVRVVLTPDGLTTVAPTGETPQLLVPGAGLVAPSVDRHGWAWTAGVSGIVAARVGSDALPVAADWLVGRTVVALAVACDGARVAVVSRAVDGVAVDLAAVVRDASGAPQVLGAPVRVGAPILDAQDVDWIDESTLAVLGRSTGGTTVHRVPVSGLTVTLPEVPDVVAMAAGTTIYITTADGLLRQLVGPSSWTTVAGVEGVRDPAFPG